jgi:hypothetical protein
MISMWSHCGEAFLRRYLQGEIMPPGIAARRGSATHKGAEINNKQKRLTRTDLPVSDLKDATRDEFMKLIKTEGVFIPQEDISRKDQILNEGLNEALSAISIYHSQIAPKIMPSSVEEQLSCAAPGISLPLAGTLDLQDEDGYIQDLKVMKRKNQAWCDASIQPSFYYLLKRGQQGNFPKGFKYQFIIPNKEMVAEELSTYRTMGDMKRLLMLLDLFERDLKAGIFKPADRSDFLCSPLFCGYWKTCKWKN